MLEFVHHFGDVRAGTRPICPRGFLGWYFSVHYVAPRLSSEMPTSPPERWPCPIGRRNNEPAAQEWAGPNAFLDRVTTLLQFDFDPIRCLCELLLGFALEFTGFARNLHLLITDQLADSALDFAANLFRATFYTFAHITHDNLLGYARP